MESGAKLGPTVAGTVCIVVACVVGIGFTQMDLGSSAMATRVGLAWLVGIGASVLLDWTRGLRNLIRADIFALVALYFLLYFEFLFPQPRLDMMGVPDDIKKSALMTCVGLGAMAVGRHLIPAGTQTLGFIAKVPLRTRDYLGLYFGSFVLANLYMWLAINFNPVEWFEQMMRARFSQPWQRGSLGGWKTLLNEFALLGYLIPPVAGLIYARRKQYGVGVLVVVTIVLLVQYFVAFAGGTRNVLAVQMAGLLGGFFLTQKRLNLVTLGIAGVASAVIFAVAAEHMLNFRTMGLKRYVEGGYYKSEYQEFADTYYGEEDGGEGEGYFVDYNLYNISMLVGVFPSVHAHLGMNLPFVAFTKPVPRAIWPGKPTDLKVGLEEAVGLSGLTISATFVGEAYVAGGLIGVVIGGLMVGIFCGWWNGLGRNLDSPLSLVVYASGFFAIMITMRSFMFSTTALLPAIALIVLSWLLYRQRVEG